MTRYKSSLPAPDVLPRAHVDAHQRFRTYGRVRPMHETPIDKIRRTLRDRPQGSGHPLAWLAMLSGLAALVTLIAAALP